MRVAKTLSTDAWTKLSIRLDKVVHTSVLPVFTAFLRVFRVNSERALCKMDTYRQKAFRIYRVSIGRETSFDSNDHGNAEGLLSSQLSPDPDRSSASGPIVLLLLGRDPHRLRA